MRLSNSALGHCYTLLPAEIDLILCRKQPGIGKSVVCTKDSYTIDHSLPCSYRTTVCEVYEIASPTACLLAFTLVIPGDGRCPICDSFVRPHAQVRVCDECNYGSFANRCCVCGLAGVADAYYCKECVQQEKDVSSNTPK